MYKTKFKIIVNIQTFYLLETEQNNLLKIKYITFIFILYIKKQYETF